MDVAGRKDSKSDLSVLVNFNLVELFLFISFVEVKKG